MTLLMCPGAGVEPIRVRRRIQLPAPHRVHGHPPAQLEGTDLVGVCRGAVRYVSEKQNRQILTP